MSSGPTSIVSSRPIHTTSLNLKVPIELENNECLTINQINLLMRKHPVNQNETRDRCLKWNTVRVLKFLDVDIVPSRSLSDVWFRWASEENTPTDPF